MKSPVELFKMAEELVRRNGFGDEIDWCDRRLPFHHVDEQTFLHEYAWVVFNSGMRNRVVQQKWEALRKAFLYFIPYSIVDHREQAMIDALFIFNNKRKVAAVITVAQKLVNEGFESTFRPAIKKRPLEFLDSLPFIGDITKYHLARNLGFDFIKPDRHLQRLASQFSMTPFELCDLIHKKTGRRLGTIDLILWRFCEQGGQFKLGANWKCVNVLLS